jgi:hypothetical protein
MITPAILARLKALAKLATPGPVVVSRMNARGTHFQVSTPRASGGVLLGNFFREGNAEYAAAAWEWLPRLVEEIERGQVPEVRSHHLSWQGQVREPVAVAVPTEEVTRRRRQPRVRKRAPVE